MAGGPSAPFYGPRRRMWASGNSCGPCRAWEVAFAWLGVALSSTVSTVRWPAGPASTAACLASPAIALTLSSTM